MNSSMVRVLVGRGLLAAAVEVSVVPGWATTEEERVKAFSVLGLGDPQPALLLMSDRDFVNELWKQSAANTEVHLTAELTLMVNEEAGYVAFIQGGIHAAQARQIANDLVAEQELRAAKSLRRNAAAEAGLVADEAMLLLSEQNFIVEILARAKGPRVRAAAVAALQATAAEQREFLATGVKAAAEQDLQDVIDNIIHGDAALKARLIREAAMRSAAAVLGMVASDGMLAMTDQNFVVAIWNAATEGTEVHAAAVRAARRTDDPAVWRAFIDTGIHEANKRDIQIRLDRKTAADRRLAEDVIAKAERDKNRNLALVGRTALATGPDAVADFLRVGQHQIGDVAVYGVTADGNVTYSSIASASGNRLTTVTSTGKLGFTPKAMATLNVNTLLITSTDGALYRVDLTGLHPKLTFDAPVVVAERGWTHDLLSYDGKNALFGIADNTLRRYTIGKAKPAAADITNNTKIDSGFSLKTLTATGPGWILGATAETGMLLSYQIAADGKWTRHELQPRGWANFTHVVSPGKGLYYGRNSAGAVYHYLDRNPYDGKGADLKYFLNDPVDVTGWSQKLLSAQPLVP
jgi:hypothetical protein